MHLFKGFLLRFLSPLVAGFPFAPEHPFTSSESVSITGTHNVSLQLFAELEELARIVDIAYCIGTTGVHPPFECASHCSDFKGFQLVDVCPATFSLPPNSWLGHTLCRYLWR
jgi:hypothetical protein